MDPKDIKGGEPVIDPKPAEVVPPVVDENDIIAQKDAEIARLIVERDNYKNAALARKGKLPADSEVFSDENFEAFMEDKIKSVLADKELAKKEQEREAEVNRLRRENSELRLAAQNRPGASMSGSGSGSSVEVKDNVFTQGQIEELTKKAKRLGADPVKFIEAAKQNLARRA